MSATPSNESLRRGYEVRDVKTSGVIVFAGLFLLGLAVVLVSMRWYLGIFYHGKDPVEAPMELPPEPRLQINPGADFAVFRKQQEELLNGYRWIDREAGVIAIPIERAMELVAEREAAK